MQDWLASNLKLRAHRDFIHETARFAAVAAEAAAPMSTSQFLSIADQKADQQRRLKEHAAAQAWG